MFRQTFKTEELKAALEQALGFEIKSLARLGGGGAINFKGERSSDGLSFVVKCFPPERIMKCKRLEEHLKLMEGLKTPIRLFADACPAEFAKHAIICLAWQTGKPIDLERLTDVQWQDFLGDFQSLSERMQSIVTTDQVGDMSDLWSSAHRACQGLLGRWLRPALEMVREKEIYYRPELIRTVHGDFHRGNLLFSDGRLKCVMDLESFRKGYPAEDICGLLLDAAREIGKSDSVRLHRLLSLFGQATCRLPYSADEWHVAISAIYLRRWRRMTKGFRRLGLRAVIEMHAMGRLCNLFRRQVDEAAGEAR